MSSTLFSKREKERVRYGRNRKPRPKTFKTEQQAKEWAERKGLRKYSIVAAKKTKFAVKEG